MGWKPDRGELNIRLQRKDINQVKMFVYLGGNVFENGRVEVKKKKTKNRPDVVGPETDNKAYTRVLSWTRVAFPKSRKASHENAWAGHLPR